MLVLQSLLLSVGINAVTYLKNVIASYWLSRHDGNMPESQEDKLIEINTQKECKCILDDQNLKFFPPLYIQRYMVVKEVIEHPIWNNSIKKVVDFGCSELGFFIYLKPISGLNNIMLVDIDFETLDLNKFKIEATNYDYLSMSERREPLTVDIYNGSIADLDDRMLGTDAVICIELIEHLYSDVLTAVPFTIFAFIKPKLAVFTTPNVEFNILFPNFTTQFRHDDHKFEWTRKQFRRWANGIILKYPEYAVQFDGIGARPSGTENVGHCCQMAIFYRKDMKTSSAKPVGASPYKLIRQVSYPFEVYDENIFKERTIYHKLRIFISEVSSNNEYLVGEHLEIPLSKIMPFVSDCCSSIEELKSYVCKLYHTEMNEQNEWLLIRAKSEYSSEEYKSDSDSSSNYSGHYTLMDDYNENNHHYGVEEEWSSSTGMHFGDPQLYYSTPMNMNQGKCLNNVNSFDTTFSNSDLYKTAFDYNKSGEDMEISYSCNGSIVEDNCNNYEEFVLGRSNSTEDISKTDETLTTSVITNCELSKIKVNNNIIDDDTVTQNSSDISLKSDCNSAAAHELPSVNCVSLSVGIIKSEGEENDDQSSPCLNRTLLDENNYTENLLSMPDK